MISPSRITLLLTLLAHGVASGQFHPGDDALPEENSVQPRAAAAASTAIDSEETVGFINVQHPGGSRLLGSPFVAAEGALPGEEFLNAEGVTSIWRASATGMAAYDPAPDRSHWRNRTTGEPLTEGTPLEAWFVEAAEGTQIRFYGSLRTETSAEQPLGVGDHLLASPWPVSPAALKATFTPAPSSDPLNTQVLLMLQDEAGALEPYQHNATAGEWRRLSFQQQALQAGAAAPGAGFLLSNQGEARTVRFELPATALRNP